MEVEGPKVWPLESGLLCEQSLSGQRMPTLAINRVGAIEIGRDAARQTYFGSLSVRISILWIAGGLASNSPAFAISAAATLPLRCASRPASSLNVSKIANDDGLSWIANQVTVPGSALTSGSADLRKSATSFSLPGLASSGTYSASLDIVHSCKMIVLDGDNAVPQIGYQDER